MSVLPQPLTRLLGATLIDGTVRDIEVTGDTVTGVFAAGTLPPAPGSTLDLDGFMLLTAPAEPHAHLDKALSFDEIDPPLGDLGLAINSWHEFSIEMTTENIAARARQQVLAMVQLGTTSIRSHVDILWGDDPLRGVRALVQVRDELAGLVDIELVALTSSLVPPKVISEAFELGIDVMGGCSHLADDPSDDLQKLLAIAKERGVGVDMHTDESLHGPDTLLELAVSTADWPASMPVTAGHCVRLGMLETAELDLVIDELLTSDVGIVSLPITNLYLQGWQHPVATPRGLTALRRLLDRGVRVSAGADNVRDPFNPVGRSDALETASLLVTAGHLTLVEAYTLVSSGARDVMSLPRAGTAVGDRADLLAIRGANLSDVIANASHDRFVIHAGRLVASSAVERHIAVPQLTGG